MNTTQFIERARAKHGDCYDYSQTVYVLANSPVTICCNKHGTFLQRASRHLAGSGCPTCARELVSQKLTNQADQVVRRFQAVHGDKYNYSNVSSAKYKERVSVVCPEHGPFSVLVRHHLAGSGCPHCANAAKRLSQAQYINRAREVHGDKYDYSALEYAGNANKVVVICPEHGKFYPTAGNHVYNKTGCPRCAALAVTQQLTYTTAQFVEKAREVHGDHYCYKDVDYQGIHNLVQIACPEHGVFQQIANVHLNCKSGCPRCALVQTKPELELATLLTQWGLEYLVQDRQVIAPLELDLYIPNKQLAIEYCGLRWHSTQFKESKYHARKRIASKKAGIQLLTIFEDEWLNRRDIVISVIRSKLGLYERRIAARRCHVSEVSSAVAREFHERYHLQGRPYNSRKHVGLYFEDQLVSLTSYGKPSVAGGASTAEWQLDRYSTASGTQIVGGFSRMFKYFQRLEAPRTVATFADLRWSGGDVYLQAGFEHQHDTLPNYWYAKTGLGWAKRWHRYGLRKQRLSVLLGDKFDPNKTETDNCLAAGYYKVYDCGNRAFVWTSNA